MIRVKEPEELLNFIAAVLRIETSAFCKVVGENMSTDTRHKRVLVNQSVRSGNHFAQTHFQRDR